MCRLWSHRATCRDRWRSHRPPAVQVRPAAGRRSMGVRRTHAPSARLLFSCPSSAGLPLSTPSPDENPSSYGSRRVTLSLPTHVPAVRVQVRCGVDPPPAVTRQGCAARMRPQP